MKDSDITINVAGHLVGTGSLHKGFTGEKSWKDIYDGNKTKATTYMDEMGGLDLSGILGGINYGVRLSPYGSHKGNLPVYRRLQ